MRAWAVQLYQWDLRQCHKEFVTEREGVWCWRAEYICDSLQQQYFKVVHWCCTLFFMLARCISKQQTADPKVRIFTQWGRLFVGGEITAYCCEFAMSLIVH